MLPGAAEATAIRSGPNGQGWWLDNRAARDAQGGLSRFPMAGNCAGCFCCHLGTAELGLEESQEGIDKREMEQQENCFPPIPSSVFLLPIQLPLNVKRFSYKCGGWGTKHPKAQSLAPPHSFQNFSCHLTHRQKWEGTPSILSPPPFPPRLMFPVITHSHVFPSFFLALLTCLASRYKQKWCTNSIHGSDASSAAVLANRGTCACVITAISTYLLISAFRCCLPQTAPQFSRRSGAPVTAATSLCLLFVIVCPPWFGLRGVAKDLAECILIS